MRNRVVGGVPKGMALVKDSRAFQEAIDWLIRQRDPAFADWEAFTAWLEADPSNADAYAEMSAREDAVAECLAASGVTKAHWIQDNEPRRGWTGRRGMLAGLVAVAASVAAFIGAYQFNQPRSLYPIHTPPGVQRTVTLAGGTIVQLNGGTRLRLDRDDPRYAELIQGEAVFAVVHDDKLPFRVAVHGAELVDLGTRFNVVRERGITEVAVSEGVVMYNPRREAVRLTAGEKLWASDEDNIMRVTAVEPANVGSWTEGRLVYENVPLSVVAGDLSRTLGARVRADPKVAARPVTAVVQIPKDREQLAPRLEKLLDIKVMQANGDWILTKSG